MGAIGTCEGHRKELLFFDFPDGDDHFGKCVVGFRSLIRSSEASWSNILMTDDDLHNRIVHC